MSNFWIGSEPVVVSGETTNYPDVTIGETESFSVFMNAGDLSSGGATGISYGGSLGGSYGGSLGGSYGGGLSYTTGVDSYNRLKDYLNYAGYASTHRTLGGVYYTMESSLSNTSVDTLVTAIRSDSPEYESFWGVLVGGSDNTRMDAHFELDLEVFVLAEYSRFDSLADVQAEFKRTL